MPDEAEKLAICSIRGEMYRKQLRSVFVQIEDDIVHGLISPTDVLHITDPWVRVKSLERSIITTFLRSLYPRRAA